MSKRISVMISLLLLSALILSLCPFAFAEEDGVIHIHTVEELMGLAKDCSLDTWSNGKKVVLESDLSLSATPFPSSTASLTAGGTPFTTSASALLNRHAASSLKPGRRRIYMT